MSDFAKETSYNNYDLPLTCYLEDFVTIINHFVTMINNFVAKINNFVTTINNFVTMINNDQFLAKGESALL